MVQGMVETRSLHESWVHRAKHCPLAHHSDERVHNANRRAGPCGNPRLGEGGVQLVPIGIRDASTFPGFCDAHEAQFAAFESQKRMTAEDHYWLQAFRTICREIYTKRHYQQKLTSGLNDYRKLRDSFIKARIEKVKTARPVNIGSFTFENDAIETRCAEQIAELSGDALELEGLYQQILDVLKTAGSGVMMTVAILKHPLPVCLSGLGVLRYRIDAIERARPLLPRHYPGSDRN